MFGTRFGEMDTIGQAGTVATIGLALASLASVFKDVKDSMSKPNEEISENVVVYDDEEDEYNV